MTFLYELQDINFRRSFCVKGNDPSEFIYDQKKLVKGDEKGSELFSILLPSSHPILCVFNY